MYRESLPERATVRLAVRYINRIAIPDGQPLTKTFATSFTLPAGLPQEVAGYLLRVILPFPQTSAFAIITQAMEPDRAHCIFDADVVREESSGMTDTEVWAELAKLRKIKNEVFFGSLTKSAMETYL